MPKQQMLIETMYTLIKCRIGFPKKDRLNSRLCIH